MGATNNFDFEEYRKTANSAVVIDSAFFFFLWIIVNPKRQIVFQGDLG